MRELSEIPAYRHTDYPEEKKSDDKTNKALIIIDIASQQHMLHPNRFDNCRNKKNQRDN